MAKRKQQAKQPTAPDSISSGTASQPRALSPDLALQPVYRGSMYTELQKFGDTGGARQMLLWEAIQGEELAQDSHIEVTGLDLTVSEDRALSALQILLDRTDYQGNIPGRDVESNAWRFTGTMPRLSLTYSEYLDAYGLVRRGKRYPRHQRKEALQALESLTEKRRIVYERKRWTDKGTGKSKKRSQVSDIIVAERPLILITKGYKGLEEGEAAQVKAGQDIPQRVIKLEIEFSPLIVDGLEDGFWLSKPSTLHQEIKTLLGKRRVSRAVSLFIEWLLTLNLPTIIIGRDKLATKLRLDYLIEQRKQSLIDERIEEAIQTALELGFLLDAQEDSLGAFHFELNPERMGRPRKFAPKKGENTDEEDSS